MTIVDADHTAQEILTAPSELVSSQALENLKRFTPSGISSLDDMDLLASLGLLPHGHLTIAGLLLAGCEDALGQIIPGFGWSYQYAPYDGKIVEFHEASCTILEAVERLVSLISGHSPVFTIQRKDRSVDVYAYPAAALYQALWNAFGHRDLRLGRKIQVLQTADRVEIVSPGGLPGGITPDNIFHAPRQVRNLHLMQALSLLGLVGQAIPGIEQMIWAMLADGKEPPVIEAIEQEVRITLNGGAGLELWPVFIEEESGLGRSLNINHLLLLRHLLMSAEVDRDATALICQCSEAEAIHLLSELSGWGYLRYGIVAGEEFWSLQPPIFPRLSSPSALIRQRQLYRMDLQRRVMALLRQAAKQGLPGVANAQIRRLVRLRFGQVPRFMRDMMKTYPEIEMLDRGRSSVYRIKSPIS